MATENKSGSLSILLRFWKSKYFPFFLHFITVIFVNAAIFAIHNQKFAMTSRRLEVKGADGSTVRLGYIPLQSDITTLISILASLTRVTGAAWAARIEWRCIFLFMTDGGITFRGLGRMFNKFLPLPTPSDFKNQRNFIIFSVTLLAVSSFDYASSVLTGSVTWIPNNKLVTLPGNIMIPRSTPNTSIEDYKKYNTTYKQVAQEAYSDAIFVWGCANNANATSMTRVLPNAEALPVGSVFPKVTLPLLVVDGFEWIKDWNATLTPAQKNISIDELESPFYTESGIVALIPDGPWGRNMNVTFMPQPLIVNETRVLILRTRATVDNITTCEGDDPTVPSDVQRRRIDIGPWSFCFVYAHLTYRAGVALCQDCRVSFPYVIQHDIYRPLELAPDPLIQEALDISSRLATKLTLGRYVAPPVSKFPTTQAQSVELLSRAYQVAWIALTRALATTSVETEVLIPIKASQADITVWRVVLWNLPHLAIFILGLCFIALHKYKKLPWVRNPAISALLLDTSDLTSKWGSRDVWTEKPPSRITQLLVLPKPAEDGDVERPEICKRRLILT